MSFGECGGGYGTQAVIDEGDEEGEQDYIDGCSGGLSGTCEQRVSCSDQCLHLHAVLQVLKILPEAVRHVRSVELDGGHVCRGVKMMLFLFLFDCISSVFQSSKLNLNPSKYEVSAAFISSPQSDGGRRL